MRRRRRGAVVAALLAVLATALGACASLPQSGPVQRGDPAIAEPGSVALLARRPAPGDEPVAIVEGFLRASAAGFTDDFTVARSFLDGPVRASWNPLAKVLVYGGQQESREEVGRTAVVTTSVTVSGTVDAAGLYAEASPGSRTSVVYRLAEDDDGEWRIVALEDGVVLSEPLFRSLFQQTALYFPSPDQRALVSETRWYPRRTVETAAVAGLLAGPSDWLAPGVVTAFPPRTRLVVDAVAVRDGTAHVDLSGEALVATPPERVLMEAQLTQTLLGLTRVRAVSMTVEGMPFEVPDTGGGLLVDPTVGTDVVVLADGLLQRVEGGSLVPLEGVGPVTAADPSDPALAYDAGPPVVLSGGSSLVTVPASGAGTTLLNGQGAYAPPSYDRHGWVWTGPVMAGSVVHAVRADATRVDVAAEWLAGRQLRSLRISRDGARALVVSVTDGGVLVEVAAVVREDDAVTPVRLAEPLRIAQRVTAAGPAAWVDQQTVAVLGRVGTSAVDTVMLVPVGGATTPLPAVDGAVALASGKGDRLLFVTTVGGELFERNGVGWTATVSGVSDPTFPG